MKERVMVESALDPPVPFMRQVKCPVLVFVSSVHQINASVNGFVSTIVVCSL